MVRKSIIGAKRGQLTSNTGKQLAGKLLYVAAGKRDKLVALQKVKDTLSKQISDNADMIPEIEGVS